MGAKWFETGRLPSEEELLRSFEGVPEDPRTGYPIGFLSMAQELAFRRANGGRSSQDSPPGRGCPPALPTAMREIELGGGKREQVAVTICPPGRAEGSEPDPPRRKAPKRGRGHQRRHA